LHATSTWEHWVVVFDGTGSGNSDKVKIYFNGEAKTLAFSNTLPATTESNSNSVILGDSPDGVGANFPGLLDDVRIYNRALTGAEAKQLYGLGKVIIKN